MALAPLARASVIHDLQKRQLFHINGRNPFALCAVTVGTDVHQWGLDAVLSVSGRRPEFDREVKSYLYNNTAHFETPF